MRSVVGRKRSAAFGSRSTPSCRCETARTEAVMPGRSLPSGFSTRRTASYVTTFCVTVGCERIWKIVRETSRPGTRRP